MSSHITDALIDALEVELTKARQSVKQGQTLLWYRKPEDIIQSLNYLKAEKSRTEAEAANVKGGNRYSLANFI